MPAPMPARPAAICVSNNGVGATPHARLNATMSSDALCITFSVPGSASIGASASGMPGCNVSTRRICGVPSASSSAICTRASCGQ